MLQTLKNAWKVEELRKGFLFTILIIVLYRVGAAIPIPYVDSATLYAFFHGGNADQTIFQYFNLLSGDAFSKATLFALSISPYINASIIMQLLSIAIPALERLSQEGEEGRKKIAQITRYVTVALALLTAFGYYMNTSCSCPSKPKYFTPLFSSAITLEASMPKIKPSGRFSTAFT